MKKLITILCACLFLATFGYAHHCAAYAIKCRKCIEYSKKTTTGCWGCYAHRDFVEQNKHPGYLVYKCPHGHTLVVTYNDKGEVVVVE